MRTLGVDFGERRIGLALSDPEGKVALPLQTLVRHNDRDAIREILDIVSQEGVERLVVGDPVNINGSRGPAANRVSRFAAKLSEESGLPCEMVIESLTSVEAIERLRDAGVDTKRHRDRVDAVAAQILLQQALDRDQGSPRE